MLLADLNSNTSLIAAELRPPRKDLAASRSMDVWIDTYHSVRKLTQAGCYIFITDSAVGQAEEENLRHLLTNLGPDANRSHIIPFLTCKHPLDYCIRYAERAYDHGFQTLVVVGGDTHDRIPRCVAHAYELRQIIRQRVPEMILGGWANPNGDPAEQARYLAGEQHCADFYLTQIVSHHNTSAVKSFLSETERWNIGIFGLFGVFYFRSARLNTLQMLQQFLPVPLEQLRAEFEEEKLDADAICARTIRTLSELGIRHVYISNLPLAGAYTRLERIKEISGQWPVVSGQT